MSVLSEIISKLQAANYNTYEGDVYRIRLNMPKYDEYVTVLETGCDFNQTDAGFGTQQYIATYTYVIQLITKKSSLNESWARARTMRDSIISIITSNRFEDVDLFLDSWEISDGLEQALDAGYNITLKTEIGI